MNRFIFDVDGTLTPSRGKMDQVFKRWFIEFCQENAVYLVTGSDRMKTLEQVGETVYNVCSRVYQCSGNEVWIKGVVIKSSDWVLPEAAHEWLTVKLTESAFTIRTGQHFEHRTGMCNFSIVGRGANLEERAKYVVYDDYENERNKIVHSFNKLFPGITATAGGDTGIDIYPTGKDKAQIIDDFAETDTLYFFGDRMDESGNDYTLAHEVRKMSPLGCYPVVGWQETWRNLGHLNEHIINRP